MIVDSLANSQLDYMFGNSSGPLGATVYIGLLLATPNSNGTGVSEPSGFGYGRQAVTNNATEWPAAAGREKVHANDIIWPAASGGDWGLIVCAGAFDALSGGNLKAIAPLTTSRQVNDTDVFRFLAATNPLKFRHNWGA